MFWLELIRLRTIQGQTERIASELGLHLEYLKGEANLIAARLYRAVRPPGDLSFAFLWRCNRIGQGGSLAAQRLIPFLREFGLVDHTVWADSGHAGFVDSSISISDSNLGNR